MKPVYREIDRMGWSRSSRYGQRPRYFLLHTEEGNASAEGLAGYLNNTANQVSYHYTVRDGIVADVVDTDYASWSVLSANSYTINLCFAGSRASWSRADWLKRENDIAVAAWLAVQDCKKYGFSTEVFGRNYARGKAAGAGISDHHYITSLGIGTHTDVGAGFPWDRMKYYVDLYSGRAPAVKPKPEFVEDTMNADQSAKLDRIHFELTERFHSRVDGSDYRDTLVGYVLNADAATFRLEQEVKELYGAVDRLKEQLGKQTKGD